MFSDELEKVLWSLDKVCRAGIEFTLKDGSKLLIFVKTACSVNAVDESAIYIISEQKDGTPLHVDKSSKEDFKKDLVTMIEHVIYWRVI